MKRARSWRLPSYIFWKAPRLWITPPEDRRHHQASLKSRLKKLTFITRTSLILCDSVPTFERVFALIPSIFKKDVFVAAPLVVCLFCLIFKFKAVFLWSFCRFVNNLIAAHCTTKHDESHNITPTGHHFPHVKTCKQQLIIIIRNNTLIIH